MNENGQNKIIDCFQSGLKAMHKILSEANDASTSALLKLIDCSTSRPQNENVNASKPPKPKKLGKRAKARLQAENSQNPKPSEDRRRNELKASENVIKENSKASKNANESSNKGAQRKDTGAQSADKSLNSVNDKACWNCGEAGHAIASCTEPINAVKVDANKRLFRNQKNRGRRNERKKQQEQATS